MSTNQSNQLNKFEDFRTRYMASQFSCLLACLLCACFSALTQLRQRIAARHRRQLLSRIAACNLHSRNTQTGHRPPLSSLMQERSAHSSHCLCESLSPISTNIICYQAQLCRLCCCCSTFCQMYVHFASYVPYKTARPLQCAAAAPHHRVATLAALHTRRANVSPLCHTAITQWNSFSENSAHVQHCEKIICMKCF